MDERTCIRNCPHTHTRTRTRTRTRTHAHAHTHTRTHPQLFEEYGNDGGPILTVKVPAAPQVADAGAKASQSREGPAKLNSDDEVSAEVSTRTRTYTHVHTYARTHVHTYTRACTHTQVAAQQQEYNVVRANLERNLKSMVDANKHSLKTMVRDKGRLMDEAADLTQVMNQLRREAINMKRRGKELDLAAITVTTGS